jgi:SAM-dependent methyltransferase
MSATRAGDEFRTMVRLGWQVLRRGGSAYPAVEARAARSAAEFLAGRVPLEGCLVLDLGSGHGSYGTAFERRGARVISLDLTPLGGPRPVHGRADRMPFRGRSFDGVVCSNLLEHVRRPADVLRETARVLRPGGWAFVSWTNWLSPFGGHEYSPWHYLGVRAARRIGPLGGERPTSNVPGVRLFPVHIGPILRLLRRPDSPFLMRLAVPRYWPKQGWILRVPGVREVATWNCVLLLERRPTVQ